jgi:LysB family phage lysis regulatory protein
MSTARQGLLGIALLVALALLIWGQQQRIAVGNRNTELAVKEAKAASEQAVRNLATANGLRDALHTERQSQTDLRAQQDHLRQGLAHRERTIEALKRENADLRVWATQPLPDVAQRLRERPTLTGAVAYRQWLSGRDPLQPAGHPSHP